jgi:hypothetical protein
MSPIAKTSSTPSAPLAPSSTEDLLTEIRDLLKAQHEEAVAAHKAEKHSRQFQHFMLGAKIVFYVFFVVSAIYGVAFYYSMITSLMS